MKTLVCIEVEHDKPIPHLADMVAGRAWSLSGVKSVEVVEQPVDLSVFTPAELALGRGEVVRS